MIRQLIDGWCVVDLIGEQLREKSSYFDWKLIVFRGYTINAIEISFFFFSRVRTVGVRPRRALGGMCRGRQRLSSWKRTGRRLVRAVKRESGVFCAIGGYLIEVNI